nr:MAG TPA: hypothetical protein [Caudoviricetes sp.]
MEGNMKAFSFDSVLLDKINTPSLVAKTSDATLPQVVKLVDTFKTKALKENQTFYRNILESETELAARKAYDQFFGTLTRLNTFYTGKYVDVLEDNLKQLNNSSDARLIGAVNEYLKEFNGNDIIMKAELTMFKFDDEIPCSKNILTGILHFFGDNFYELSEDDARKLLEITTNNQSKILKRAKAEIIDADPDDIEVKDLSRLPDIFVGETTTKSFRKECVGKCIEIVKSVHDDLEDNLNNAREISKEYKKLLNKVIQYRNSTKIRVNTDDYIRKIERIIISMISEIWTYHLTVYAIKAQYIRNNYYQAKALLSRVSMMATEEIVDDTVEAVAVESAKFLKEQEAMKFTRLTDREVLMNHITDMKHNDLIMDCCIKEAIVLAEGVDVENRLAAIHEGAWDKVKEFFNKIKEFVMNLFTKVENWFDKFFKANKEYIEKYKDQIDKQTAGFTTVNMPDYAKGLERIMKPTTIQFAAVFDKEISADKENDDIEAAVNAFRKSLLPDDANAYDPAKNEWKEACNNYFTGGENSEKDYSPQDLNMRTLADRVLKIPNLVENLKRDKTATENGFKALESAINKRVSTLNNPTPATDTKKENTYLYGDVFAEGPNMTMDTNNAASPASPSTSTTTTNGSIADASNAAKATAATQDKKGATNAQKLVNKFASTVSTYYQCKYQMAEKIMSDYMKIIKAHVSAYVNANNDSEKAQQSN